MTLPASRGRARATVFTTLPSPVRSLTPQAEHVPQPDVETRWALAGRLRPAGVDAPIDAIARCRCGQPIVNDEVYGWLHLATAEQATRDKPETAALRVAVGPQATLVSGLRLACPPGVRREENVAGHGSQHCRASEPGRVAGKAVAAPTETDHVLRQGGLQVLQDDAVGGQSQVQFLPERNSLGLHEDAALAGRGYPGAALHDSCGRVLGLRAAGGWGAASGWVFARADERAVMRGSIRVGLRLAGWW